MKPRAQLWKLGKWAIFKFVIYTAFYPSFHRILNAELWTWTFTRKVISWYETIGRSESKWMNKWASEWLSEWVSKRPTDRPKDRPTDRPTDRAREQTEEWMSGCWDFCMCVDCKEYCVFPFFSNINGNKKKKNRNTFPALCQSTGDASNVHMCLYKTNTVPCIVHTMTALPNPPAIHIGVRACVQLCAR